MLLSDNVPEGLQSIVYGILYTCLNCPVHVGTPLRVPPRHGTMVGSSKSQHKWETLNKHDSHKSMLVKPSENYSTGQHKICGNLLPEGGHKENIFWKTTTPSAFFSIQIDHYGLVCEGLVALYNLYGFGRHLPQNKPRRSSNWTSISPSKTWGLKMICSLYSSSETPRQCHDPTRRVGMRNRKSEKSKPHRL